MSSNQINRVTLFKIPNEDDRKTLLAAYETVVKTNQKDGKPYIVGIKAGHTLEDQRSQGYTLAVQTTFTNLADMRYYDTDCVAHKELKKVAAPLQQGILTLYFEAAVQA